MNTSKLFVSLVLGSTLFAAGLLSGCDGEFVYRISEGELQEKTNEKLPFEKVYFSVLKTTLERAEITLVGQQVQINFDATIETKGFSFFKKSPVPRGSVEVIATPIYHKESGEVFLTEAKVLSMNIEGYKHDRKAERVVESIIAEYLSSMPVYKLTASDLKRSLAKDFLQSIEVEGKDLVLKFGL